MSRDKDSIQGFYAEPTAYAERMGSKFDERWAAVFAEYARKTAEHCPAARRILDLGCGNGHSTLQLMRAIACETATGVDISETSLRLGRENLPLDKVKLVCADVHHLPFPDASFDLVTSHAMVEHLIDAGEALDEMDRVLAPGGTLVVSAPNMLSPVRAVKLLLQGVKRGSLHPDGTPWAVIQTLIRMLKRTGLQTPLFEYRQPVQITGHFAGSDYDAVFLVNPWDLDRWARARGYSVLRHADSSSSVGAAVERIAPFLAGGVHFIARKPGTSS